MDIKEAKELLSFHSGRNANIDDPRWENGFLGSLRPFRGELKKENFIEIMECLKVLKDELAMLFVERDIMSDIMGIIHFTRAWASPVGMLGRNKILTQEQTNELLAWVDMMEACFVYLLEGSAEEAFYDYELYMKQ